MTFPPNFPPEQVPPTLINEAVRRAVLLEECESYGHQFSMKNAVSVGETPNPNNEGDWPNLEVKSQDESQLPHIQCTKCHSVWIVIDEPGFGYDDALRRVQKRMGTSIKQEALKPRPKQERISEERTRAIKEKQNLGKNIPSEVMVFDDPTTPGAYIDKRFKVPNYLQPRNSR